MQTTGYSKVKSQEDFFPENCVYRLLVPFTFKRRKTQCLSLAHTSAVTSPAQCSRSRPPARGSTLAPPRQPAFRPVAAEPFSRGAWGWLGCFPGLQAPPRGNHYILPGLLLRINPRRCHTELRNNAALTSWQTFRKGDRNSGPVVKVPGDARGHLAQCCPRHRGPRLLPSLPLRSPEQEVSAPPLHGVAAGHTLLTGKQKQPFAAVSRMFQTFLTLLPSTETSEQ